MLPLAGGHELLEGMPTSVAGVALAPLILGLALQLVSECVRTRGWYGVLRAAYPEKRRLRVRDVVLAYFAGAGLGAIVAARGNDLVKVFALHRRMGGGRAATTVATFVPEGVTETCI